MQTVNSHMNFLGRLPSVWRKSIWKHHRVLVPYECLNSWLTLEAIHRELMEDVENDSRLQFRGFLTDGGIQDNDTAFWVDNMFHSDISSAYSSSAMNSHGVRCIGLYRPKFTGFPRNALSCMKAGSLLGVNQKHSGSMAGHTQLCVDNRMSTVHPKNWENVSNTKTMVVVRRIQICKGGGFFVRPVDRGIVLLGNESSVKSEYGMWSTETLARGLYSQTVSSVVSTINGFVNLASVLVACQSGMIDTPVRVGLEVGSGGVGEWVEFGENLDSSGAMRPVVWFRMYSRNECIRGWTRERRIQALTMKAKFAAMGTEFLIVSVDGNTTKRASGMLNIPLANPVIGDAVCTVLSSSEPVMEDVIKIPSESNYVEVNYVWLLGKEVNMHTASGETEKLTK